MLWNNEYTLTDSEKKYQNKSSERRATQHAEALAAANSNNQKQVKHNPWMTIPGAGAMGSSDTGEPTPPPVSKKDQAKPSTDEEQQARLWRSFVRKQPHLKVGISLNNTLTVSDIRSQVSFTGYQEQRNRFHEMMKDYALENAKDHIVAVQSIEH
jgi:hypothetical protein